MLPQHARLGTLRKDRAGQSTACSADEDVIEIQIDAFANKIVEIADTGKGKGASTAGPEIGSRLGIQNVLSGHNEGNIPCEQDISLCVLRQKTA